MILTMLIGALTFALCTAARWTLDRPGRQESRHFGDRVRISGFRNPVGAFGLPLGKRGLLALSAAALALVASLRRITALGTGLILGGGLSNFRERWKTGEVFDYLHFPKAPGALKRYVYNLADLAIFLGMLLLLLRGGRGPRKDRRR